MDWIRRNATILAGVFVLVLGGLAGIASAFDTGTHFDITHDVLKSEGFSANAIRTAQAANFMVDYYEFMGSGGIKKILDPKCLALTIPILTVGDAQHFDDLGSTKQVADKWDEMLYWTQKTVEDKTKTKDLLGLMALLGMSLHNVQDFYTHSNWVEGMDGGTTGPSLGKGALAKYGDHPTWLSMDRKDREALDVYTYLDRNGVKRGHGRWDSPDDSLNKDWSGRRRSTHGYLNSYVCAWFATRQWVRLYHDWVKDPTLWSQMQGFSKTSFDPERDWYYAYRISFYGGHWYGNGGPYGLKEAFSSYTAATSPDLLAKAVLGYMGNTRCIAAKKSALRAEAERLLMTWGLMPYKGPIDPALPNPAPESLRFVKLEVHRIENVSADDGLLGGELDWYSEADIGGQPYWSGLIDEHNNFNFDVKPYGPWTMTKVMPPEKKKIPILFELKELDYDDDDTVDINPRAGAIELLLAYDPATGLVSGDVTGKPRFTVKGGGGDGDAAQVELEVSHTTGSCLK